jgi:hypothetical protein
MSFETAMRTELMTVSGLSNKVFPMNAPEGTTLPYLAYVSSEGVEAKSHDGYLDMTTVDCEISVVHSSYASMKSLTGLVINELKTFQGATIGTTGPFIQNITYEAPVELYEAEIDAYRSIINIQVIF